MRAIPVLKSLVELSEVSRGDRRLSTRYPIALELQCKLLKNRGAERTVFGRTLNMSSGGILIEADRLLPASGVIELSINWPLQLEGACSLKLVIRGRIIRSDANATAIKAEYHQFRTAGVRSRSTEPSELPSDNHRADHLTAAGRRLL
jgi:hypothetical protein